MNATCNPFSMATSAAMSATIVLPGADIALEQSVHGMRALQILDNFA
jgi:hypothetical protein